MKQWKNVLFSSPDNKTCVALRDPDGCQHVYKYMIKREFAPHAIKKTVGYQERQKIVWRSVSQHHWPNG